MKLTKFFSLSLLTFFLGFGAATAQTPAQNKENTKKVLAAIDAGDVNTFAMYVSPSVVEHTPFPPGTPDAGSDFERMKLLIASYHTAFPDSKTTIKNIVAEGNMVIVHSLYSGTNKGAFMGMPATNKAVSVEQVDIIRYDAAGKGVEHWAVIDQLTMLQQLGIIPTDGK